MFNPFGRELPPTIERIGAERSQEAAALHAECFTYHWPQDDLEALLAGRSSYANGAVGRTGDLYGFIVSRVAADEAEILTVAVSPKKRGLGIARRLLNANMEQLQIAGARTWFLEVEAQNTAALALYKRTGFERVGERKSYYRKADGDAATAYILRRSLR